MLCTLLVLWLVLMLLNSFAFHLVASPLVLGLVLFVVFFSTNWGYSRYRGF